MEMDIFESMAMGVQGAGCIVAFLSQRYQESDNCKIELKYAMQRRVPIVPVLLQAGDWEPSGWLGLVIAGKLWTSMHDPSSFDRDFEGLLSQINAAMRHQHGGGGTGTPTQRQQRTLCEGAVAELEGEQEAVPVPVGHLHEQEMSVGAMRKELQQLKQQLARSAATSDNSDGLAFLPAGVPALRDNFQATSDMSDLKAMLLAQAGSSSGKVTISCKRSGQSGRVGAFGMGGIGKTMMASWIARDADVRKHFELILWVTLSQTPNISKLQQLQCAQCGIDAPADGEAKDTRETLSQFLRGKRALLILDDVWDQSDEQLLNCVDAAAGSKTLVTTRIRGLLSGAELIEVGLPEEPVAIKLLLESAGLSGIANPPPEAAEIVHICGRLPLAIDIAGSLLADLGLRTSGDADWRELPRMLREEMKRASVGVDGDDAASLEYRVISASLSAIPLHERAQARQCFSVFACVAEDVAVPLYTFGLMLQAISGTQVTSLAVRKQLQLLINRSLVLGSWEAPQLHDIVREYLLHKLDTLCWFCLK